jgi:hypothetical protein
MRLLGGKVFHFQLTVPRSHTPHANIRVWHQMSHWFTFKLTLLCINTTRASPNRSYFYTEFIFKLHNIKYKILTIAPLTSADMSEYSKKSIFLSFVRVSLAVSMPVHNISHLMRVKYYWSGNAGRPTLRRCVRNIPTTSNTFSQNSNGYGRGLAVPSRPNSMVYRACTTADKLLFVMLFITACLFLVLASDMKSE